MIQDYYHAVTIQRKTVSQNTFGAPNETWANHLTTTGLLNDPSLSAQRDIASKYQVNQPFNFYTNLNQDIKQGDRIFYNDEYYRIVSNPKNTVNRNHHLKFICDKLDGEV